MPYMYKIFDERNGKPTTLYHGVRGSKTLPLDQYVIAERKIVKDAKGNNYYESGFHLLNSVSACARYLNLFKNLASKRVCKVYVPEYSSIWLKNTKRKRKGAQVSLAGIMCIDKHDWDRRITIDPLTLERWK